MTSLRGDYHLYIEAIDKLEPEMMAVLHEIASLIPGTKIEPMP